MDPVIIDRFNRHLILPGVGQEGVRKLLSSSVLVVGCGGLGSAAAYYICAAGVGTIGMADPDTVELSNLQRQILHREDRVGIPKTASARLSLSFFNSITRIYEHPISIDDDSGGEIIRQYHLIIDATDNIKSRYVLNRLCHRYNKPLVTGAVNELSGIITTIIPGKTHCYQCLFPQPSSEEPAPAGILSPIPGVIGTLQALEAIKVILGLGNSLAGRLLVFDGLNMEFETVECSRHPQCPICKKIEPSTDEQS